MRKRPMVRVGCTWGVVKQVGGLQVYELEFSECWREMDDYGYGKY